MLRQKVRCRFRIGRKAASFRALHSATYSYPDPSWHPWGPWGSPPSWYGLFLQKMKRPICMTFGTLAAAALPLLSLGVETECVPSLPPKLTASLQSSYPGFHVLNLKELNPDDQKIWQA